MLGSKKGGRFLLRKLERKNHRSKGQGRKMSLILGAREKKVPRYGARKRFLAKEKGKEGRGLLGFLLVLTSDITSPPNPLVTCLI